ncbi:glycosyltransferase [Pedobacter sp. Leaf132]|uniref:glycosyltransferase n=1 Tax=Pedobacter sp. Leaf132 TaxID=2876557 RepID=UPI001E56E229|nr:glycosyltransferase [Pedobacter sp. Leaf132]
MSTINIFWIVIQVLIGYHLVLPIILFLFYKFKRNTGKPGDITPTFYENDYAIIVTAYEQVDLLPAVVESLLKIDYNNYLIYIVADNCDITNLNFVDDRVILLRPETILASNTKSHFYAIKNFKRKHNILTIIDSDNIVDKNYLKQLDAYFEMGFEAVQGIRAAKNLDSTFACLDAARDIYYHFYDGEILFKLGSSATLAGSGMAFTTSLYKNCLENLNISGAGFDKVLQAQILKQDKRIAFAKDAIVFDEKTSQSEQLVNQRSRWINTWFKYFGFGFNILGLGLRNLSINQILFGLILLRPPLFMFILSAILFGFIDLFIFPLQSILWFIALIIFVISFYISLKNYPTDARIFKSLLNIPKFIYFQLISLLNARNANKRSVATKHRSKN